MARAFQVNVAEFRDNQGKIHRGKLYIGTFGNDALDTHSGVTLYSDEAQSQTIANPINLDIEGSPGLFYVPGGKYSYAVYDSSGKLAKGTAKATGHVDTTAAANTNLAGVLDVDGYLVGTLADEVTTIQLPVKGSTFDGAFIEGAQAADGVAGGWTEVLAYYNGLDTPVAIPANIKVFGDTDGSVYQFTGANPNSDPESDGGTNWTLLSISDAEIDARVVSVVSGNNDMWIPARDMYIPSGSTATRATHSIPGTNELEVISFPDSAVTYAIFSRVFPRRWDLGNISYQYYYVTPAADVVVDFYGTSHTSGDTIGGAGTSLGQQILSNGAPNDRLIVSAAASGTISGSPADGDWCHFQITRSGTDGNDTETGAFLLIGVRVSYNADQVNDA